jgi:hypothetical protein
MISAAYDKNSDVEVNIAKVPPANPEKRLPARIAHLFHRKARNTYDDLTLGKEDDTHEAGDLPYSIANSNPAISLCEKICPCHGLSHLLKLYF